MLLVAIVVVVVVVALAGWFAWRGAHADASVLARLFSRDEPRLRQMILRDSRYPAGRHDDERVGRFAPVVGERVLGGTLGEYSVRGAFGGREFAVQVVETGERQLAIDVFTTCGMTERLELVYQADPMGVVHPRAVAADASAQRVAAALEPEYLRGLVPAWFAGTVRIEHGEMRARTQPGMEPESLVAVMGELLHKLAEMAGDLESRERATRGPYQPAPPPTHPAAQAHTPPPTATADESELAPGGNRPTHIEQPDADTPAGQPQPTAPDAERPAAEPSPSDEPLRFNRPGVE